MAPSAFRAAVGVALPYLLFAVLWIVFSDKGVGLLAGNIAEAATYQTVKGIVFVAISAGLIFVLSYLANRRAGLLREARYRAEDDLARVLETVNDAVWMVDGERHVVWRGHWTELTGYAETDLDTVEAWLAEVHPEDRTVFADALEALFKGPAGTLTHEHRIRAATGSWMWVRAQARGVTVGGTAVGGATIRGDRIVGTYTDLTELRQQEQHLSALAHSLGEARTELDTLASAAAHDLRQPVREVVSYAQILERRLGNDLPAEARQDLRYLINAAHHQEGLLNGLMRAVESARAMPSVETVDLGDIARRCLARHAVDLEVLGATSSVGDLPTVQGDAGQLEVVIGALISNAIKFRSPVRRLSISVTAVQDGPWWRIVVTDNGIGLPPEFHEQIFQAFRRLHGRGEYDGAGMGLAICRSIAARHGGTIEATADQGVGARLVLSLPVDREVGVAAE